MHTFRGISFHCPFDRVLGKNNSQTVSFQHVAKRNKISVPAIRNTGPTSICSRERDFWRPIVQSPQLENLHRLHRLVKGKLSTDSIRAALLYYTRYSTTTHSTERSINSHFPVPTFNYHHLVDYLFNILHLL